MAYQGLLLDDLLSEEYLNMPPNIMQLWGLLINAGKEAYSP
ncbi:hypothetical protein SIL85_00260 [Shewanella oneidensis]|nr:hypothetical protein [Shewanella oneidensis]MDX5995540.1 hypothetical protein [Shewanella oneidensis]